jgi:anti-sigma-K factor RskA
VIPRDPEELDALAGEYVLGVLGSTEAREVEEALPFDASLREAVRRWEERFGGLAAALDPVDPPRHLWERIQRKIAPAPQGLWENVRFWRPAALAGIAAAAALLFAVFLRPGPSEPIAVLQPAQQDQPSWVVHGTTGGGIVVAAAKPPTVPAGRVLQLWAIVPGAPAPLPLGLVGADGRLVLPDTGLREGTTLALSLEPAAGSPTGLPTGPVLFTGEVRRLRAP